MLHLLFYSSLLIGTLEIHGFPNFKNEITIVLYFQANYNARDGRIMVFNLVEAAQEFLSELVTVGQSNESVRYVQIKNFFKILFNIIFFLAIGVL